MFLQWIPCHRRPDRSIKIASYTFPLCARCLGIFIGYLFLPFLIFVQILRWWMIPILMIPLLIDGYTQKWKLRESNNFLRMTTGILFGIAQSVFISISVRTLINFLIG